MNRLARNSVAAGLTTLLMSAGISFPADAAEPIIAQGEASAVTATGLTDIVDTAKCRAESDGPATDGTGTCGTGLASQGTGVINQNASTGLEGTRGTSTADASVASVDLPALTTIDPSTLEVDVDQIDTATILDDIVAGLDPITRPLFQGLLTPLLDQIQAAAVAPITSALQQAVPVSVNIGAVTSQCTAVAGEEATGGSTVSTVDIVLDLGSGGVITVPVTLNTDPNSPLVGSVATTQLVTGVLTGIEDSLDASLNGVLVPLANLVPNVQETLVDGILAQIGPALIDPLGDALTPVLTGTVNKQEVSAGAIEVTALSVAVVGETATLDLARSSCGPNAVLQATDDGDPTTDPDDNQVAVVPQGAVDTGRVSSTDTLSGQGAMRAGVAMVAP